MAEILEGKLLAKSIREKAKASLNDFDEPPGLAAILVGDDAASRLYVGLKEKAAKEVGIYFEKIKFTADTKESTIIQKINELNKRDDINGILVQLPLPNQNEDKIIAALDPLKDVDGFHPINRAQIQDEEPNLAPPVALAVMRLIQASHQPLGEKTALIVANNPIFADPLIEIMKEAGISAQFISSADGALGAKTRAADILVVAVGQLDFIKADMVKDGAIIIDVGTNKKDGKTVGDVAAEAHDVAGFVSPVPGGVGPLTVAYLINNVIRAALLQKRA